MNIDSPKITGNLKSLRSTNEEEKNTVLFVGAFPPSGRKIYGGNVTDCRTLMQSSFPKRVKLHLVDSTQISNPPPHFFQRLYYAIKRLFAFVKMFERKKPDALLLFCSAGASLAEKSFMAWYARLRKVPSLIFPRGGVLIDNCKRSRITAMWVKFAVKGATKFLCQGLAWQRFGTKFLGFDIDDAPIITNWTASNKLLGIGAKRKYAYNNTSVLRIVYVGWVEKTKGVLDIVEAVKILIENGIENFKIEIVGDGNAMSELKTLIKQNNFQRFFSLDGWLDSEKILKIYSENDIFILPSYFEGLPNAMIEAMAAGLAVITTPVGSIPDIIENNFNGLLVRPENPEKIAKAIELFISDPNFLISIANSGYLTAKQNFGVEDAVEKIIHAINSAVEKKRLKGSLL